MASKKRDVLNRLDSLLLQDEEEDDGERGAANSNGFPPGTAVRKKARSIRFADDDELHEIIGYSERYSDADDSDEADDEPDFRRRGRNGDDGDDVPLTVEERNVINITKKNTNFNAHAQNLLGGALRLGDKRHVSVDDGPLLVTVRPFSSRSSAVVTEPTFAKENKPVSNSNGGEMSEVGYDAAVNEEQISRANFAAARLSFLNSTLAQETAAESIQKHRNKCVSEVEVEMKMGEEEKAIVKSETGSDKPNGFESKGEERRRAMSEVSPEAAAREEEDAAAGEFKGADDGGVAKGDDELFENANVANGCRQNAKAATVASNKPQVVKLMRRTSSNSPGSTILKGTPKPVVVVKSKQAAPAPPLPAKEKPKIPAKPKILLTPQKAKNVNAAPATTTTTTPVAAPRRGPSFNRKDQAPAANPAGQAIPDSASEYVSLAAECYSTQADAQNEVIFEVNATRVKEEEDEQEMEDEMEDAAAVDRQEKNRNALDEIKKSLEASRYDDGSDGQSNSISSYTSSSLSASSATTTVSSSSSSSSSSASSSFDEARASVASALTFNRHDAVARPSTKKNKAPKPPTAVANEEEKIAETDGKSDSCNSPSAIETTMMTKREGESCQSTPTMPPSALRNANKSERPTRVVQFSPDTKTTSTQPSTAPVPYNKWIASAGVFESSFTGQPVKVAPVASAAPTATVSRRPVKSGNAVTTVSSASSVTTSSMSTVTPG